MRLVLLGRRPRPSNPCPSADYDPHDTTGVQVRNARCHVDTVQIKTRLALSP